MLNFPQNPEEARNWKPEIFVRTLHRQVLAVANTRVEGAWCAYIAPVPGKNHDEEFREVRRTGTKLPEEVAKALFPRLAHIPYAR